MWLDENQNDKNEYIAKKKNIMEACNVAGSENSFKTLIMLFVFFVTNHIRNGE